MKSCDIAVFGAGIIDIPVIYADHSVFTRHSTPVEHIGMTTGGDALNEATVLANLGHDVRLISCWGCDPAGAFLDAHCDRLGIDTQYVRRTDGLDTGVNVVLVDEDGERRFYNNRHSSLRKLRWEDLDNLAILFEGCNQYVYDRLTLAARENPTLISSDVLDRVNACVKREELI